MQIISILSELSQDALSVLWYCSGKCLDVVMVEWLFQTIGLLCKKCNFFSLPSRSRVKVAIAAKWQGRTEKQSL